MDKATDSKELGCPATLSHVSSSKVLRTCSCDFTESSRLEETNPVPQDHLVLHLLCAGTSTGVQGFGAGDPALGGRYRAEDLIPLYLSHLIHKTGIITLANLRRL